MITTTLGIAGNLAQGAEIYRSNFLIADDIGISLFLGRLLMRMC